MKIDSIMVLCILFAPYTLFFTGSLLTISGMTWVFLSSTGGTELLLSFEWLGRNLFLLILPQVAFAIMMHRVYQGETSFRMAVFVGIIGTLISTMESITDSIIMLFDPSWYFGWRTYPVPVIMLVAYLHMKRYPPPVREKVWPEE